MRSYAIFVLVACLVSSIQAATPAARPQAITVPAKLTTATLPAAAELLAAEFQPIGQTEVRQAARDALGAVDRLNRYLEGQGSNGNRWKQYLKLGDLQTELGASDPDLSKLLNARRRLHVDHPALERPALVDVVQKLDLYLETALLASDEQRQADLSDRVARLPELLNRYGTQPMPSDALELGHTLAHLEDIGRMTPLVSSVRQLHSYPNLYGRVSEDVLGAGIGDPVDRTEPVIDCILGTYITGWARTCGATGFDLIPSRNTAVFDITFNGVANSRTVGRNGPATIYSRGRTTLSGRKRTVLDESGIRELPAQGSARTSTTITGISVNRGGLIGGFIQRVASRRASQSKSQAEAIAGQHAEVQLERRLDEEGATATANANRDYRERLNRWKREGVYPQQLKFSSTSEHLLVRALEASREQLGAPTAPIQVPSQADVALQVHESLPNNLAETLLAGQTVTDDELRERLADWFGEVPEEFRLDPEEEPWSVTFADEQPVTVEFRRGGFTIAVRGDRFTSGDNNYAAMNITARYKLNPGQQQFSATRVGELEIFPPGFDPNGDQTLSARQQALRRLLERRFGKIFTPELTGEGFVLPGRLKDAGTLRLTFSDARSGWIALGWDRPPATRSPRLASARSAR